MSPDWGLRIKLLLEVIWRNWIENWGPPRLRFEGGLIEAWGLRNPGEGACWLAVATVSFNSSPKKKNRRLRCRLLTYLFSQRSFQARQLKLLCLWDLCVFARFFLNTFLRYFWRYFCVFCDTRSLYLICRPLAAVCSKTLFLVCFDVFVFLLASDVVQPSWGGTVSPSTGRFLT